MSVSLLPSVLFYHARVLSFRFSRARDSNMESPSHPPHATSVRADIVPFYWRGGSRVGTLLRLGSHQSSSGSGGGSSSDPQREGWRRWRRRSWERRLGPQSHARRNKLVHQDGHPSLFLFRRSFASCCRPFFRRPSAGAGDYDGSFDFRLRWWWWWCRRRARGDDLQLPFPER